MDKQFEQLYHNLEQRHWWFKTRREVVLQLARPQPGEQILDIGCASGNLLEDLLDAGISPSHLWGIDVSAEAIGQCHQKGLQQTFVMDGADIQLQKESFDLLIASDCLEHIEADEKALKNWYSLLRPGGRAVVFVPAFQSLWSEHDEVNYHFRRYKKDSLVRKMMAAGFHIDRAGYWNFTLFFPIAGLRWVKNKLRLSKNHTAPASDLAPAPPIINTALTSLLRLENKILKNLNYPFGVSTFCLASKK